MSQTHVVGVPEDVLDRCFINDEQYLAMYERSIRDPEGFWAEQADIFIDWTEKWSTIRDANIPTGEISWFGGGKLNISYNCIDRHLEHARIRPPSSGKATTQLNRRSSPISNCTTKSAGWPMPSRPEASKRGTGSASTCR